MAFAAGQAGMFPIEPETGIIVVELFRIPVQKSMATLTIIGAAFKELSLMHILVAIGTSFPGPGKILYRLSGYSFPEMTAPAGNPGMLS